MFVTSFLGHHGWLFSSGETHVPVDPAPPAFLFWTFFPPLLRPHAFLALYRRELAAEPSVVPRIRARPGGARVQVRPTSFDSKQASGPRPLGASAEEGPP
jgi:hypothetical protein